MQSLPLSDDILKSFKLAKLFKQPGEGKIIGMDFDDNGEFCITTSDDDTIVLYDCLQGKERKTLYSKKYGIHHVKFAHSPNTIIHTSTKEDDTIRYLSLHDNRYLRYFKGHKSRVVSLDISPVDDTFISGSLDDTVRLWDLRSNACQGCTHVTGQPIVSFDPQGLIFALALGNNSVRFYDLRNFEQGPFGMVPPQLTMPMFSPGDVWTGMKFSNNGRDLLISTRQGKIYVIDSMDYKLKFTIMGIDNRSGLDIEASFTPDGNFILSGSESGKIHIWSAADGKKVTELEEYSSSCTRVQFNPKRMLIASSAGSQLGMWIPSLDWA